METFKAAFLKLKAWLLLPADITRVEYYALLFAAVTIMVCQIHSNVKKDCPTEHTKIEDVKK